ncbi:hypothetical protein CCR80_06840 [Rhodothalassium salexigens]|uniref:hypothetical protein n=1 Tax=Rhodothalassium salexigens TaxID=1086 RepID=UPI00191173C3|nr:hypothetical protein [Rhodothalassium salexigens]MBK5920750.1 hypothetical protein [Rhodothalassium salexigens]
MSGFLAPFFIAFGIAAGLAIILTALAAVAVILWFVLSILWFIVRDMATWPAAFAQALRDTCQEFKEAAEEGWRRHGDKPSKEEGRR